MAGQAGKREGGTTIVIRREEAAAGGHHGGAWKVAYADFVTAMMAFFLLMWLLNATTEAQRKGLAEYFSPNAAISHSMSGFGAMFGGHTPNDDGMLASDRSPLSVMNSEMKPVFDVEEDDTDVAAASAAKGEATDTPNSRQGSPGQPASGSAREALPTDKAAVEKAAALKAEAVRQEHAAFETAAKTIKEEITKDPALAGLARQISVDITPDGLRIQILDEDKQAMFTSGSAVPNDRARALLVKVAPVLMRLPESLSIVGHTDATPFKGSERSNWELSADRANATRRILVDAGLPEGRVQTVAGRAEHDPLLPADPFAAANRRIAITVLRNAAPSKPAD